MKEDTKKIIEELRKDKKKTKTGNSNNSLNKEIDIDEKIKYWNAEAVFDEEKQKRKLRDKLVITIKHIIWFQLLFFNIVVLAIVLSVTTNIPIFREIEKDLYVQMFEFLKYYIGATIVELLGMLVLILKFVFSRFKVTSARINAKKRNEETKNKIDKM